MTFGGNLCDMVFEMTPDERVREYPQKFVNINNAAFGLFSWVQESE